MIFGNIWQTLKEILAALGGAADESKGWIERERLWSVAKTSTALVTSFAVKATAGSLRSLFLRVDAGAPEATYYLHVVESSSLPADGAVTHVVAPIKIVKLAGIDYERSFDHHSCGIPFAAGCQVYLSSTEFTKTISAGDFLSISARYA